MNIEAFGPAANCRLGATDAGEVNIARNQRRQSGRATADEDRLYGESLVFEEAPGNGDAKRQLVVPGKTDKDDPE